ncbi:MAG: hypothetical protein PHU85_09960 [Phycisphaerae bacterium]|nr:hypothetical protein [Phycisphaerae bacterium]
MPVTKRYLNSLDKIYRDILAAFPQFDATRRVGYGLAYQSLYSALDGKYSLGEIKLACEQMAQGGAVEIRNKIFVHPTALGEELIAAITGQQPAPRFPFRSFSPPHR